MDSQTPTPPADADTYTSPERELALGSSARREAGLRLAMNERLARLNALCKQMTAIVGAANKA